MNAPRLSLLLFAACVSCSPLEVKTPPPPQFLKNNWSSVSKITSGLTYDALERPSYHQHKIKTMAQQSTLVTEALGIKKQWWGYSGPKNIHTQRLRFICGRSNYLVPEPFVNDLLDLHVDFPTHASIDGNNRIFSMEGCGGEKCYTVHFCFQSGRFQQRILDYTEEHDIYITQQAEQ
jgi:hypothetical protein